MFRISMGLQKKKTRPTGRCRPYSHVQACINFQKKSSNIRKEPIDYHSQKQLVL